MAARGVRRGGEEGITALVAAVEEYDEQRDESIDAAPDEPMEVEQEPGVIWKLLLNDPDRCRVLTGFPPLFINQLVQEIMELQPRRRGKAPQMTVYDDVCVILNTYRTAAGLPALAAYLDVKKSNTLGDAIRRIRPYLYSVLVARDDKRRQAHRPQPFPRPHTLNGIPVGPGKESVHLDIGVAVDCTPCPIPKPAGRSFEANKEHYDAHHGIYARKIEVCVSTTPPHFAVSWSSLYNGSTSDIEVDRKVPDGVVACTQWLEMTVDEKVAIWGPGTRDKETCYWAAVYDSGFLGAVDVPFPRAVIPRPSSIRSPTGIHVDNYYKKRRVVVEQFFGRMKKTWKITAKPYPYDVEFMEKDYGILLMLTNEHIELYALAEDEATYYRKWLNWARNQQAEKQKKHAVSQQKYRKRLETMANAEAAVAAAAAADPAPVAQARASPPQPPRLDEPELRPPRLQRPRVDDRAGFEPAGHRPPPEGEEYFEEIERDEEAINQSSPTGHESAPSDAEPPQNDPSSATTSSTAASPQRLQGSDSRQFSAIQGGLQLAPRVSHPPSTYDP